MGWRWLGASRCLIEDIGTREDAGYRKRGEGLLRELKGWVVMGGEPHEIIRSVSIF